MSLRVTLRDLTDDDLNALFDIQADETAQHVAAFTSPDQGDRNAYRTKWRKIIADDEVTKKAILVDGEVVGSVVSFMVDGATEVTYWVRRDLGTGHRLNRACGAASAGDGAPSVRAGRG